MTGLCLIASLAGERIAIPAGAVEAVVEIEGVTPVPRAEAHVAGLAALRSRVLTVIDCLASLELGRCGREGPWDALVVTLDGHAYALLVDQVEDVLEFSGELPAPRGALVGGWRRVAKGMVRIGGDLLLLVDPAPLIAGRPVKAV